MKKLLDKLEKLGVKRETVIRGVIYSFALGLVSSFMYFALTDTGDIVNPRLAAKNANQVTVYPFDYDGCEYLFVGHEGGGIWNVIHKGNCRNPIHERAIK